MYEGGWASHSVSSQSLCGEAASSDTDLDCKVAKVRDWPGMVIIFIGFFISGIGTSFFYSFGIPYIDDNVSKRNSPMVLSLVLAGRTLGPALGYVLGTATLKIYVVPGGGGDIQEGDPGWLGAWWLGFVIISVATLTLAPLLALFPERLPTEEDTDAKRLEKLQTEESGSAWDYVRDTLNCGKRLIKNKVYVFNSLSTILYLFGFIGFGTFVPKYFEYHFRRSASSSGSSGGMSKAGGAVVGILVSGWVLARFKFRARLVTGWNVFIGVSGVCFFIAMSFVACPRLDISGVEPCEAPCHCSRSSFLPTCSSDGSTLFFSPCHAGCTEVSTLNLTLDSREVTRKVYSSCSCVNTTNVSPWWTQDALNSPLAHSQPSDSAIAGYCPFNCSTQFTLVIGLLTAFSLLGSTGRIGNQLISLRAVEPRDKSAGIIIMVSLLSLFVFLPSPIIVASIMDNSCLEWGSNCGERTNCVLYDTDAMRKTLCFFVSVCLALATVGL